MAGAFAPSLSLPSPIFPLTFKFTPFSSLNPSLFPKSRFIPAPITITNAKNKLREASGAVTVEYEDFYGDDEEEGEDEEFLAFEDMRKWELSKPSGFGEGKVYDTTVEEKLLEENEKDRMAQIASDKKVKNSSDEKQEQQPQKGVTPSGHSVRLGNLPKKRNIHRDLQIAFKGFAGIVNINPVVTGNRKTRDPVCKGFAFVEFESKEAANRFVSTYSRKDIVFGKVQKQISCEFVKPRQLVDDTQTVSQPSYMNSEDETLKKGFISMPLDVESNRKPVLLTSGTSPLLSDPEEKEMSTEHLNISPLSDNENENQANALGSDISASSFQKQRKQMIAKKKLVKKKSAKTAKLSLPASMARLKIKERTVLTGVFSKYGGKISSTSD